MAIFVSIVVLCIAVMLIAFGIDCTDFMWCRFHVFFLVVQIVFYCCLALQTFRSEKKARQDIIVL